MFYFMSFLAEQSEAFLISYVKSYKIFEIFDDRLLYKGWRTLKRVRLYFLFVDR